VSPVKYELGFYIPEGDFLDSDRRENLKYCKLNIVRRDNNSVTCYGWVVRLIIRRGFGFVTGFIHYGDL
jgi:hypothetical protein